jgi:hypothetical protein
VVGPGIDQPQLAVLGLVTGVDHTAAADVCDGVRDASGDGHEHDRGDCHGNATKASVHG